VETDFAVKAGAGTTPAIEVTSSSRCVCPEPERARLPVQVPHQHILRCAAAVTSVPELANTSVHHGSAYNLLITRQANLDAAFEAHPTRFKGKSSQSPVLPSAAWTNPPRQPGEKQPSTLNLAQQIYAQSCCQAIGQFRSITVHQIARSTKRRVS